MAYVLFCCGPSDEFYSHHQQTHFLESCFMCQKPLGLNRDIFMYRGITAFCSDECRQEQIEIDEANERSWNLSASMNSLRKTSPATTKPSSAVAATSTTANSAVAGVVRVA